MPAISIQKAALINAASKYTSILLNLFFTAVLARLLTPKDYGIVAITGVFTTFFSVLAEMGIGTAVIQHKDLSTGQINSIYTFSLYLSVILSGIFAVSAFPISIFFKNDVYKPICLLLSLSVFFNALNMIPNAVLMREKKFLGAGIRLVFVTIITFILTFFCVKAGLKYYALVIQSIAASLITFLWNKKITKVQFQRKANFDVMGMIKKYSGYLFAFNTIAYFTRNLDKLIIGKLLGDVPLAQYEKAYKMMLYPIQNLTYTITPVLHPILSDYQDNKEFIYAKYIKLTKILSLLGIFFTAICFWANLEIIILIFGRQWHEAARIFKWLSLSIWAQMITGSTASYFQSLGNTKTLCISGIIAASCIITSILAGIYFSGGDLAVISSFVSLGFLVSFIIYCFFLVNRGFKKSFIRFICSFGFDFVIFFMCMLAGYVLQNNINTPSLALSLVLKTAGIGAVFMFFTCVFNRKALAGFMRAGKRAID